MAGAVINVGSATGGGEDFVDAIRAQRLAPPGPFQRDEHSVGVDTRWAFVSQVVADGGEELVGDRHHPLMSALAFDDEQRPVCDSNIAEAQGQDLATP